MFWSRAARCFAIAAVSLGVAGCNCAGINVFTDNPIGARTTLRVNETLVLPWQATPLAVTVSELKVWINFETSAPYSEAGVAQVFVNGREVPPATINYSNYKGLKATGKVELSRWMRPGANTIAVRVKHGLTAGSNPIRLRAMARFEGVPAGGGSSCYEGDSVPPAFDESFKFDVNYQPSRPIRTK